MIPFCLTLDLRIFFKWEKNHQLVSRISKISSRISTVSTISTILTSPTNRFNHFNHPGISYISYIRSLRSEHFHGNGQVRMAQTRVTIACAYLWWTTKSRKTTILCVFSFESTLVKYRISISSIRFFIRSLDHVAEFVCRGFVPNTSWSARIWSLNLHLGSQQKFKMHFFLNSGVVKKTLVNNGISTTNLNWWIPDFWNINTRTGVIRLLEVMSNSLTKIVTL